MRHRRGVVELDRDRAGRSGQLGRLPGEIAVRVRREREGFAATAPAVAATAGVGALRGRGLGSSVVVVIAPAGDERQRGDQNRKQYEGLLHRGPFLSCQTPSE